MGDWKLIEFFEDGTLELYNTKRDISEQNNLADAMPDKVEELHQVMRAWRAEVHAPVPTTPNPRYDPSAVWPPKRKNKQNDPLNCWAPAPARTAGGS